MMKTRFLGAVLLLVLSFTGLFAQDDISSLKNNLVFNPILDGKLYAVRNNKTAKLGIFKDKIDWDYIYLYTPESLEDLVVLPLKFDDIFIVRKFYENSFESKDPVFRALLNGENILFDLDGRQITRATDKTIMWYSLTSSSIHELAGISRKDGNGCDILLQFEDPAYYTIMNGPYQYAWFESAEVGKTKYYCIKARENGSDRVFAYDVFGNPLRPDDLLNLESYYKKLRESDSWKNPGNKEIIQLASIGDQTSLSAVAEQLYKNKKYTRVLEWALKPGLNFCNADAIFYGAQCMRLGLGGDVRINSAQVLYEIANQYAKPGSSAALSTEAGLLAIKNIEKPIKLKSGNPAGYTGDGYFENLDFDLLERLAKEGWLGAIRVYCHKATFFSLGSALFDGTTISDHVAVDVLPLLLAAAPLDANCQFMLACVYAGDECMGLNRNYGYSFRKPDLAKKWLNQFLTNPKRSSAHCWGYSKEQVDGIVQRIKGLQEK